MQLAKDTYSTMTSRNGAGQATMVLIASEHSSLMPEASAGSCKFEDCWAMVRQNMARTHSRVAILEDSMSILRLDVWVNGLIAGWSA